MLFFALRSRCCLRCCCCCCCCAFAFAFAFRLMPLGSSSKNEMLPCDRSPSLLAFIGAPEAGTLSIGLTYAGRWRTKRCFPQNCAPATRVDSELQCRPTEVHTFAPFQCSAPSAAPLAPRKCSSMARLYIKQACFRMLTVESLAHRSVTQSVAISPTVSHWLYRRSLPLQALLLL